MSLASQGSSEGLWQVSWGGQFLAGPLSGGQAQNWTVTGGEAIADFWEVGWTARGPGEGQKGPRRLGSHGPWVAELNKVGPIELGWGSGALTLQRITWVECGPHPQLWSLSHSPGVKHWATHSWIHWLDLQPLRGPRWKSGQMQGLCQTLLLLTSLQLLAPQSLLTEPNFVWIISLPRSDDGSSWVPVKPDDRFAHFLSSLCC